MMPVVSRDLPAMSRSRLRTMVLQMRKKKWKPIDFERLDLLAQPRVYQMPLIKDPFVVTKKALTYKITKRIKNLAIRKEPPEIPLQILGVAPSALKAIGNIYALITIQSFYYSLYCRSSRRFLSLDTSTSVRIMQRRVYNSIHQYYHILMDHYCNLSLYGVSQRISFPLYKFFDRLVRFVFNERFMASHYFMKNFSYTAGSTF